MSAYVRYFSEAHPRIYVSSVLGRGGKDWGYSNDPKKAIDLSPYWARRFEKQARDYGYTISKHTAPAKHDPSVRLTKVQRRALDWVATCGSLNLYTLREHVAYKTYRTLEVAGLISIIADSVTMTAKGRQALYGT